MRALSYMSGLLALALIAALGGCERYPADIRGSLEQAKGSALDVGVSDAPPWITWNDGDPQGAEADIIRNFARQEGLEINWIHGDEEQLMPALEHAHLHLVAAGLTKKSPWSKHVSLSVPISKCRAYIGVEDDPGLMTEGVIKGLTVRVERAGGLAYLVEKRGARVKRVDNLDQGGGPAAAEEYRLAELGLIPVGEPLETSKHMLALPKGENALYAALTRSLPEKPGCLPAEGASS